MLSQGVRKPFFHNFPGFIAVEPRALIKLGFRPLVKCQNVKFYVGFHEWTNGNPSRTPALIVRIAVVGFPVLFDS